MFRKQDFRKRGILAEDFEQEVNLMSLSFGELEFLDNHEDYGKLSSSRLSKSILSTLKLKSLETATKVTVPSICQSSPLISQRSTTQGRDNKYQSKKSMEMFFHSPALKSCHASLARPKRKHPVSFLTSAYKRFPSPSSIDKHEFDIGGSTNRTEAQNRKPKEEVNRWDTVFLSKDAIADSDKENNVKHRASSWINFCAGAVAFLVISYFFLVSLLVSIIGIIFKIDMGVRNGINVPFNRISDDIHSLAAKNLFGQHLVLRALRHDFNLALQENDTRVVTLLLLGPSGCGKSLTRHIIEENFNWYNLKVAQITGDAASLDIDTICKINLDRKENRYLAIVLEDSDKHFSRSMTIINTIAGLKHCLDYEKIILVVVSSAFSNQINDYMFDGCKVGERRLQVRLEDLLMDLSSTDQSDSLQFLKKYDSGTRVVPLLFLPLEDEHVRMCIETKLKQRHISKTKWAKISRKVLAQMDFHPQCYMKFSESGCKLVSSRIDYVVGNDKRIL